MGIIALFRVMELGGEIFIGVSEGNEKSIIVNDRFEDQARSLLVTTILAAKAALPAWDRAASVFTSNHASAEGHVRTSGQDVGALVERKRSRDDGGGGNRDDGK